MRSKSLFVAAFMLLSAVMYSQPQGGRPEPPQMKSLAEMAKDKADMMQFEVGLDNKQYKKVYKLFKKDFQYRQSAAEDAFQGGMPPQGPGMGGPGGGMQGGPGMGGPGGGMQGGPGMGGHGGGMQPGQMPGGAPGMRPDDDIITEEYLEKQDAKLRKILTDSQYTTWRSKHPVERLELPPMESAEF